MEEYSTLVDVFGNQLFGELTTKGQYNVSFDYMTKNRSGGWEFYCMHFDSKSMTTQIKVCNSWFNYKSERAKCILDTNKIGPMNISGLPSEDLIHGNSYTFRIENSNVGSYSWNVLDDRITSNTNPFSYTPQKEGCKALAVQIQRFGGFSLFNCFKVYVMSPTINLKSDLYEMSAEEEVIAFGNYGRMLAINGDVWLTKDVGIDYTTSKNLPNECPPNYRYLKIFKNLLKKN